MALPPPKCGEMGHCTGFLGRWNYPQGRGTRPIHRVRCFPHTAYPAHLLESPYRVGIARFCPGCTHLALAVVDAFPCATQHEPPAWWRVAQDLLWYCAIRAHMYLTYADTHETGCGSGVSQGGKTHACSKALVDEAPH